MLKDVAHIFDRNEISSRTFNTHYSFSPVTRDMGYEIQEVRYKSARAMADLIVDAPGLFTIKEDRGVITVKGRGIVLTEEELASLVEGAYRRGRQRAQFDPY